MSGHGSDSPLTVVSSCIDGACVIGNCLDVFKQFPVDDNFHHCASTSYSCSLPHHRFVAEKFLFLHSWTADRNRDALTLDAGSRIFALLPVEEKLKQLRERKVFLKQCKDKDIIIALFTCDGVMLSTPILQ